MTDASLAPSEYEVMVTGLVLGKSCHLLKLYVTCKPVHKYCADFLLHHHGLSKRNDRLAAGALVAGEHHAQVANLRLWRGKGHLRTVQVKLVAKDYSEAPNLDLL